MSIYQLQRSHLFAPKFFSLDRRNCHDCYLWAISEFFSFSINWTLLKCSIVLSCASFFLIWAGHFKWRPSFFVTEWKQSNIKAVLNTWPKTCQVLDKTCSRLAQNLSSHAKPCHDSRFDLRQTKSKKWHDQSLDTILIQDLQFYRISTD